MVSSRLVVLALLVFLVVEQSAACRDCRVDRRRSRERGGGRRAFEDLELGRPRELFRSEGGKLEEWDPNSNDALCDAEVGARKLTLERNGLAVPCYKDSPVIKIITRGSAKVGIINPFSDRMIDRTTVFRVEKGDTIALPRGTASWIFNDGEERTEVLEVADTSNSPQCGRFNAFLLAGGKQENYASVLHGFSKEMLAHAFDIEERTVEHILQGEGAMIVKVDERKRMSLPDETNNNVFVDYVYRWEQSHPDVRVRDAGELRLLNSFKLPLLRKLRMGGAYLKLQPGAMTAPGWIHNAHKLMYIQRGNGRIQVARENGEQALDEEVNEGSLLLVPANYPCAKLAGNQGLHYISIFTNDQPVESYIAGRNSVYRGMPRQVVSSGLQIDEETQRKIEEARSEDAYLFPPRRESRRREHSILDAVLGAL